MPLLASLHDRDQLEETRASAVPAKCRVARSSSLVGIHRVVSGLRLLLALVPQAVEVANQLARHGPLGAPRAAARKPAAPVLLDSGDAAAHKIGQIRRRSAA